MAAGDLEAYVRAWRARFETAEQARWGHAAAARAVLPVLVRHLVEKYAVRRVWAYGSLIEGGFHEHSDIDVAAEGLPPGAALFRAAAELDDLAKPFRVDLVPIEEARVAVRERILTHGEVVHESR